MPNRKTKLTIVSFVIVAVVVSGIAWYAWRPVAVNPPASPASVVDDFGRNVVVSKVPERIVSLAPGNTEILFALGLGPKVVGVTMFCDYPPEVPERVKKGDIATIGGFADPSIERIVALNPDLVLASASLQKKVVKDLEDKGIIVIALSPKKVEQILADIRLVGDISGKHEEAEKLASEMQRAINIIRDKMKNVTYRPRVYYEIWYQPLYTIGPGTWQNELIEMAGGINLFADAKEDYPIVSSEVVIQRDPEIIIVPTGYMGGVKKEDYQKRPGWSSISAVKDNRIYEIDEETVLRPGPRIVQGLEQLARFIHPEILGSSMLPTFESAPSPESGLLPGDTVASLETSTRITLS